MKWYQKFQFKTWFGELCGNTISLMLALAFISFLAVATEGTLMAVAATSFIWSWKARWNPFRSGFLPAIFSTSLLQAAYFISGSDMLPKNVSITMFIGNLVIISIIAALGSGIGTWVRSRTIKKKDDEKNRLEKNRSQFSDNLKRLAMITLFFYIQMFIVVPLVAKVHAEGIKQTSDEFIENYDPANKYSVTTKTENIKPKRMIPLESPYSNVSGIELEQLEAYCQANGCSVTVVGAQLSQLRLKGTVTLDSYFGLLNKTYAPKPKPKSNLILPKVVKGIKDFVTGKNKNVTKNKPDNRPWYKKAWDGAKSVYNAYQSFDHAFTKAVQKPFKEAWNFAQKHPWQAAGIATLAVGLTVAAIVSAPLAAALGVAAVIGAGVSAFGIAKAYHDNGWNGVRDNVLSKETQALFKTGDIAGALGSGTVDVIAKAIELVPVLDAPEAAVTVVKGIKAVPGAIKSIAEATPAVVNFIKEVPEMRVVVAIVDDSGILNSGGIKVVKNMMKNAGENIKSINPFIKSIPEDSYALATVNNAGKGVEDATKIAGVNESLVIEKKAGEVSKEVVSEAKASQPYKIDLRKLPKTKESAVAHGTLPKASKNMNLSYEDLEQIELANKPRAHGIEKHVEKDNMYLESRDIEKASTFNTKESYVKNVNTTLSRDADKINAWLKNPDSTRLRLDDLENNDVIGRIIIKDANHTGIATKSKLILQKNNSGGYYILTNPIFP
jgi:hypothetical protein